MKMFVFTDDKDCLNNLEKAHFYPVYLSKTGVMLMPLNTKWLLVTQEKRAK